MSWSESGSRGPGARRVGALVVAVLAGLALLVGCAAPAGPAGTGGAGGGTGPASGGEAAPIAVAYEPGVNAADVSPAAPVAASVPDGSLRDVTLTGDEGPVPGAVSPDGKRWAVTAPLAYDSTYTWSGTVTAPDGRTSPLGGTFRTLKPEQQVRGTLNIGDGRAVGVAAPIEIQFDAPVQDKAAVERALSVTTSTPVEGSWGWLPDQDGGSRVHWRPKEYWPSGTKVDVAANLLGVNVGGGAYGKANLTTSFSIGRSQIVKADTQSFRMVVIRDGKQVMDVPASYGLGSDPQRNTRSGVHVVTEKFTDKRMTSQQYGYDVMEKWAVRMSNNGEFIHANPASSGAQGSDNVTHGCVNLSTTDAKAYYDTALYGDPVEVTGSGVNLSARDGDIYDWALPYTEWKTYSALM